MAEALLFLIRRQVSIMHSANICARLSLSSDDPFCHFFANEFNLCVVSINYRKAPSCPFPGPVQDAAEIAQAVLDDIELPFDRSKVAMGGFSAGGNLALAIAQMEGLRGRIRSLIPVYPVVDFSGTFKGSFRTTKDGRPDLLANISKLFDWGYISQGQDLIDPLLSPIYAKRENLPPNVFMIGAEYDVLCHEAEVMALRLAGDRPNPELGSGDSWEREDIKWRKVLDVQHSFTHIPKKGQEEVERKKKYEDLYKEMADWLRETL
jgi:acetyl esterase/lipase